MRHANPTPLAHSAESAVLLSTQPTTEQVKGKDQPRELRSSNDGASLRVGQLKIDDGHFKCLKFPPKNEPQEGFKMQEVLPELQIDGVTPRSESGQPSGKKSDTGTSKAYS